MPNTKVKNKIYCKHGSKRAYKKMSITVYVSPEQHLLMQFLGITLKQIFSDTEQLVQDYLKEEIRNNKNELLKRISNIEKMIEMSQF